MLRIVRAADPAHILYYSEDPAATCLFNTSASLGLPIGILPHFFGGKRMTAAPMLTCNREFYEKNRFLYGFVHAIKGKITDQQNDTGNSILTNSRFPASFSTSILFLSCGKGVFNFYKPANRFRESLHCDSQSIMN